MLQMTRSAQCEGLCRRSERTRDRLIVDGLSSASSGLSSKREISERDALDMSKPTILWSSVSVLHPYRHGKCTVLTEARSRGRVLSKAPISA